MRTGRGRIVLAVVAVACAISATPAHASDTHWKHYVAAGGGPTAEGTPLASCGNSDPGVSVGGACFTVTGDVPIHVEVHDATSPSVAAYWQIDTDPGVFFCNAADLVASPGQHRLGVWVGGVNMIATQCPGGGQASTGSIKLVAG